MQPITKLLNSKHLPYGLNKKWRVQLLQINLNYLESVSWGQMCTSATQRRNRLSSMLQETLRVDLGNRFLSWCEII